MVVSHGRCFRVTVAIHGAAAMGTRLSAFNKLPPNPRPLLLLLLLLLLLRFIKNLNKNKYLLGDE
jgi:hypothetical protein